MIHVCTNTYMPVATGTLFPYPKQLPVPSTGRLYSMKEPVIPAP